jgi:hypothetical protein
MGFLLTKRVAQKLSELEDKKSTEGVDKTME